VSFDETPVRLEFELGRQKNDADKVKISDPDVSAHLGMERSVWTYMCNAYVDIHVSKVLNPFIEFGVGAADVEMGSEDIKCLFAIQMGFGVAYTMTDHIFLDLKYTCFVTDTYDVREENESYRSDRLTSHQVQLGLRYQF
jgi:opacity protein-like surface antigen